MAEHDVVRDLVARQAADVDEEMELLEMLGLMHECE